MEHTIPSPVKSTLLCEKMDVEPIRMEFPALQNPKTSITQVDSKHQRIMSNLKASIFAKLKPDGKPISDQFKAHIEQRLHYLFPSFSIPCHPPYASMIQKAILELNDEKGSSKEAISALLRREYENLPCGRESFLAHHLKKLCGDRDIKRVNDGRYVLLVKDCDFKEIAGSTNKSQNRRGKQLRNQGRAKKIQKKCESERQPVGVTEGIRNSEMQLGTAEINSEESRKRKRGEITPIGCNSSDDRYNCIMSRLKDSVFEHLAARDPLRTIKPELKSYIEQRLHGLFKDFDTPDHPPYAHMIKKAILEVNRKGWLTEEEISAFIKGEFKDLPFGHESFLHLRLMKYCKNRNLVFGSARQYKLPDKSCDFKDTLGGCVKKRLHKEMSEEDRQVKKQKVKITEISNKVKEQTNVLEEHNEAEKQKIGMTKQPRMPWSQVPPCAIVLKQHDEQITLLERGVQELAFDEQREGQASFTAANSLTKEFAKKPLVFSFPWKQMESSKYDNSSNTSKAKRKKYLPKEGEVAVGLSYDGSGGVNTRDVCRKQLQIRSPCVRRELVCAIFAQRQCQSKISGKQMAAKSRPVQVSNSPESCIDTGQQLPKSECQGRPAKRKRHKDMITENKSPPTGRGRLISWKEQRQQQLECSANGSCSEINLAKHTTPALLLCSHDQDQNKQRQLQA